MVPANPDIGPEIIQGFTHGDTLVDITADSLPIAAG